MSATTLSPSIPRSASRPGRIGAILGGLTVAGFLAAYPLGGGQPHADASAAQAVAFWTNHHDGQMAAVLLFSLSALALVGFGVVLRDALRPAGTALARAAYAGTLVAATGLLVNVAIAFAAADTVGDVAPAVTQTLSTLSVEFAAPIAVGFALFLLASGAATVRSRILPTALGVLAAVVAVTVFTPATVVAFWGVPVWIVILSAWMWRTA